jgi:glycosyltransferase involved in cell wall biosynthesis
MNGKRSLDLSIVIPAYGSARALDTTLRALSGTEPGAGRFEVIVVDDGSPESLRPVAEASPAIPTNYVRLERNSGRSAARNAGAALATGRRLLFLDCDSIPTKGLVHGHATAGDDVLLGARIDAGWEVLDNAVAGIEAPKNVPAYEDDHRHIYGVDALVRDFAANRAPWMYCYSHNLSMPRDAFAELGGFDEAFVEWGWEDLELGYRFFVSRQRAGGFEYRPDIACLHLPHFHLDWAAGMNSPNVRYLKQKHPYFDTELLGTALEPEVESKIRHYEELFAAIRQAELGMRAADVTRLLPQLRQQRVLWVGAGLGIDDEDRWQIDHGRAAGRRNLHLVGVGTPFQEREFDAVVNVDLWRFLTPPDLSLVIREGLRVGGRLLLFASDRLGYSAGALRMEHLGYLEEAYGAQHRALKVSTVPGGAVVDVAAV